jgi:L-alanine-DL-glutamate epimerase-like enolase superfamily enzyme
VPPTSSAGALLATLARLPVVVADAVSHVHEVWVPDYPDGPRPSSTVALHGAGEHGCGELVAWTRAVHERFAGRLAEGPRGAARLGDWIQAVARHFHDSYERAALEAAAIDLAFRQHETNLFRLAGVAPRPARYVVSFGRAADPLPLAAAVPASVELKIDVDPAWSEETWAALAALGRVAVLDFKGSAADLERAARLLPAALLEDPAEPVAGLRWSADATITSAAALEALPVRPAAVNVKPARMGGVLEALGCVARCDAAGISVYFGGMFEVGCGRRQLWDLAALLAPDGPNDVAPIAAGEAPAPRPARLVVDPTRPGFGA